MEQSTADNSKNLTTENSQPSPDIFYTKLLVGPIIGKVTRTTARILIEVPKTGQYTILLKSLTAPKVQSTKLFYAEKADVFVF